MNHQATIRDERFKAAVDLASGSPASFRRTARRFSICSEDAEDAYQRGLEILLTKAPTDDRSQLRPWLHTVIKHEALSLRNQRERMMGDGLDPDRVEVAGPDERAPERERARHTAEALGQLKRSELQCMLLKALGYSYDEIAERTGYSWTKVNRSLTEGRRSFFDLFGEISSGASCDVIAETLELAARGDVSGDRRRRLDAHLSGCASCRAELREHRTAPAGIEVVSPAILLGALRGSWWERAHESVSGAMSFKVGQLFELVGSHKVAAVAASTAALASGAAVEHQATTAHRTVAHAVAHRAPEPRAASGPSEVTTSPPPESAPDTPDRERPTEIESRAPEPEQPAVASEFEPAPAAAGPQSAEPPSKPPKQPTEHQTGREFTP